MKINDNKTEASKANNNLDNSSPKKIKSRKPIIIIAVVLVVIIAASMINSNHSKSKSSHTENPKSNYSYSDDDLKKSDNDNASIDLFDAIENVYYDESDKTCLVKYKSDYNVDCLDYNISYGIDTSDNDYTECLKITRNGVTIGQCDFITDNSTYVATGTISVKLVDHDNSVIMLKGREDKQGNINDRNSLFGEIELKQIEKEIKPLKCSYNVDHSAIPNSDIDKMLEVAEKEIKKTYPLAKLEAVYYGYDEGGTGDESLYGIDHGHYNEVKFVYSYVDNGHKGLQNVNFYDVKYAQDGKVIESISVLPIKVKTTTSSITEIDEYEKTQKESWRELYKLR